MQTANRSFFRCNIGLKLKNFSKANLICINNVCFGINAKPFSEKLEFKLSTRKKIINGQRTHNIGIMVFTNVHKAIRVANFIANISIVQSDGNLHYFCEADLHNLIEKNGFDQSWKSTINADEIFADEKNFLEEKFTGTLYCSEFN
ncbi:hypothetical protein ACKWTF_015620 [Chironomus riparius]